MKKIRILEAIRQGSVGGGETHVYDLTTRLDKTRFEPTVLSFTDGPMVTNLRAKGVDTHVIHSPFPFDFRVMLRVTKLIKERKIDLIHAHGTRAASNLLLPAWLNKVKLVYTVHGWSFNDNQSRFIRFIRQTAERFIASQAALTICVSESNKQTGILKLRGFNATVINNGISLDKFNSNVDNTHIIKELNKQSSDIWIGLIARITKQKDPITLLNAFNIAQAQNPNLKLLIVGQGDLDDEVKSLISTLGLASKVHLMPFRADIPEILRTIDIYCLPSLWEGLPIGLIEAMAMNLAVIATDVDGTREIVTSETGIIIPKENPEILAEKILLLAGNSALRTQLGNAAQTLIKSRFELTAMVQATESAYDKLFSIKPA